MAIAILVIFWVVIGGGVVLVAMSATKKPKSDDARGSRAIGAVFAVGLAVMFIVGTFAIPAVIMVDNGNADQDAPGGVHLTQAEVHGRELFASTCSKCHVLRASDSVGEIGPDLDQLRPPAALVLNAIQNGVQGPLSHMPPGLYNGSNARDIAAYVQAVAGR
jgi:mono/diheme cytochrome c family protein